MRNDERDRTGAMDLRACGGGGARAAHAARKLRSPAARLHVSGSATVGVDIPAAPSILRTRSRVSAAGKRVVFRT